jgi:MFS family permease
MFGACASLVAELIAPTVASSLMMKSPWIPILIGAGILVCGTFLITLIPETTHLRAHGTESEAVTPDSVSERSIKLDDSTFLAAAMSHLQDIWRRLVGSLFVLRSFPVIILLMTFVVNPFGAQSVSLCIRYVSVRFLWSLSQAGYLLSIRALINIFVMLGLIPGLSHYLTRKLGLSSKDKDLLLSKFSVIFLVFGAFLIAASPTVGFTIIGLMIWTLGTGFVSLTRSLITTLVDEHHVGRLYAAVSIVETLGALSAGPLLATLYNLGLHWKGPWVGLPFFLLSLVSLIAGVEVWIFGCVMRKARKEDASYRGEEEESARSNALLLEPNFLD